MSSIKITKEFVISIAKLKLVSSIFDDLTKEGILKTLKLFQFLRYSRFCYFFPSSPQFPDSKGQMRLNYYNIVNWVA